MAVTVLKQRLLTAAILIPLVIGGIFYLPNDIFAVFVGLFAAVGAWEWARLARVQSSLPRALYVVLVIGLFLVAYLNQKLFDPFVICVFCCAWWVASLPILFGFHNTGKPQETVSILILLSGMLLLCATFTGLTQLRQSGETGPALVMVLFILIWGADSGAFFAGRAWGKTKLAPQLSPKKTWEGVAGAAVITLVISLAAASYLDLLTSPFIFLWFALGLLTLFFSVVGDLMESMIKRLAGIKDSGTIFPGHGGVLDRIDSLLAATPFFFVGWTILQTVSVSA